VETIPLRAELKQLLEGRAGNWVVLAAALAIALPTVSIGFFSDDHLMRSFLSGGWPGPSPPAWDLYRFATGDLLTNRAAVSVGGLPWWSAPELKLHLLRPLSSLLLYADYRVFGDAPYGYHLHAIAWYVALVAAVGALLRLLLPRATAQLALLIYACSAAHFHTYAWVSARHMVVAALPCVLGLTALCKGARGGPWLCALGLALGLTGSEAALSCVGFALGFAAFSPLGGVRQRIVRVLPTLSVALLYVGLYAWVGAGAAHSEGYVDPLHTPLAFAGRALAMLPMLFGNAALGVPVDLASVVSPWLLIGIGLGALALVGWLTRSIRAVLASEERQHLPWLVLGAVLALIPALGGFPGARVLLLANIGFAPLLAALIRRATARAGSVRAAGVSLAGIHLVLSPLGAWGVCLNTRNLAAEVERIARTADIGPGRPRVYVLGVSDPMVTMYVPAALAATAPERLACWSVISGSKQAHRLERPSANQLVLHPQDGPLITAPFETLYRSRRDPFQVGDTALICGATYRVLEVRDGLPTQLGIELDRPLEHASIRLLKWQDNHLIALPIPAVGSSIHVGWAPGPLGLF
jgi:hypothetical protein